MMTVSRFDKGSLFESKYYYDYELEVEVEKVKMYIQSSETKVYPFPNYK